MEDVIKLFPICSGLFVMKFLKVIGCARGCPLSPFPAASVSTSTLLAISDGSNYILLAQFDYGLKRLRLLPK